MGLSSSKAKADSSQTSAATTTPIVPTNISGPASNIAGQIGALAGQTAHATPASTLQNAAFTGAANLTDPNNPATAATRSLLNFQPDSVTPQTLASMDLSKYTNPWDTNVVNAALGDIERFRSMGINNNSSSATLAGGAGAFGGSRAGVTDSLTNEAALRQAAETAAQLRQAGFTNAQDRAVGDINNNLAGQEFNVNSGTTGAGLRLGAAGQLDSSARANVGLQGDLGAQQHAIDQANNPQNAQTQWLTNLLQLLQGSLGAQGGAGQQSNAHGTSSSTTTSTPSLLDSIGSLVQTLGAAGGLPIPGKI